MKQDMIVILDLGSHENTVVARAIRALGVYSEIYPHDITAQELKALPNVKGIIINGGPNNVIDGVEIDVLPEIYEAGFPVMAAGHDKAKCEVKLAQFGNDEEAVKAAVESFVLDTCKAEKNWNMTNFVNDQVELIRKQVGNRKVLLALSGGVDSSVVAALLLKAIGENLVCVHVNHGLMRKGESENVVEVFRNQLCANLVYVDATDRFLDKLAGVALLPIRRNIISFLISEVKLIFAPLHVLFISRETKIGQPSVHVVDAFHGEIQAGKLFFHRPHIPHTIFAVRVRIDDKPRGSFRHDIV